MEFGAMGTEKRMWISVNLDQRASQTRTNIDNRGEVKLDMTDVFTRSKRSWVMSRIRGRDTTPEKVIRSMLHSCGFRFRLHVNDLPGRPDVVLPKYRTVIFVNGCFWHHHAGCKQAVYPKHRSRFWRLKIDRTVERDKRAIRRLR